MRVLDLFSGIGGFSLGLERAGMRTRAFCEVDPFCREWRERGASRVTRVRVNVTEKYLRRLLGLKKRDPLIWRGIAVLAHDTPPTWPVMATC